MVVLLSRNLKYTGGDRRSIKGVWISLLFPLFSADTLDVKRFAQVFLYQCSHWRASAYVGGPNLLTWYGIYHNRLIKRRSCSTTLFKYFTSLTSTSSGSRLVDLRSAMALSETAVF